MRVASNDKKIPGYLAIALRDAGQYHGEQRGDLVKAMQYLTEAWQLNNQDATTARLLGVANGVQGAQAAQRGQAQEAARFNVEALEWFKKAAELAPKDASILFDLGTAYMLSGDAATGNEWHKKALEVDPQILEKRRQGR
jgi:Flp pilus assembly protein TadD